MIFNDAFEKFLAAARAWHDPYDVLDGDCLVDPPVHDFGYFNTPANSLTFLKMGVDGVHIAILKLNGAVRDESPIIYVTPMDSDDPWTILAPTFLDFLADGCAMRKAMISELLNSVESDNATLIEYLQADFDRSRLLDDERVQRLNTEYLHLAEKKDEYKEMEARWSDGQ